MIAEWVSPERAFVVGLAAGLLVGFFGGAVAIVYLINDNRKGRRP